jgi:sugar (pentulose or hexulose) kinase
MGVKAERIRITGGASKNDGVPQIVADVFQASVERLAVSNAAALGAALIAAVAAGQELSSLRSSFCQAAAGSALEPDLALGPIYQDALCRFEVLLKTVTSAGRP